MSYQCHNLYIIPVSYFICHTSKGQTTQLQKRKGLKNKQRSTKHTYKTKDRVTRTPLKPEGELMCCGRVSSSCSTSGTRRVNIVANPVISHKLGHLSIVLIPRCFLLFKPIYRFKWFLIYILSNSYYWQSAWNDVEK
jgi:hypothetical protein